MPDSLNIATLFPLAAIRPSRPAEPFRLVLMEENVSDYQSTCQYLNPENQIAISVPYLHRPALLLQSFTNRGSFQIQGRTYGIVDKILVAGIVVDVYRDAP
ncbi:hypothetical protein HYALB_00011408 [Hymenoscyphus albidus]|uniref:Uncharacterized protein n=1 Tax=Hymenoscyphus albidus TaxID=595503 RepID=A0A9N9LF10_9HELO|nr:hypothetical protein HYALB_00011408 [Hymenoscyphus albidus]